MGLHSLPPGHVGAVVTYLEMTKRPPAPQIPESPLRLAAWETIDPEAYRALFRKVGGRWLWFSRLEMDNPNLLASVAEMHCVIDPDGREVGMLELDFSRPGECLIKFLGLVPELAGRGHGRWLFAQTLKLAWRGGVGRVRVNTCTLDHPAALPSYLKEGFAAYARAFESFPDPRLSGLLPRDIAPQIPVLD
ncbi:MAG TPA: GNAT family N-acetyltransferase [Allosphingosinicella sp.]|nr:GNAT family N-acetyltransferase [Allosphingosinicella sp.]